jgi:hypothetical protein
MGRRGQRKVPISLFSFQDIITSVMGVIIMITLFLAVELVNRKENSPPIMTSKITNDIDDTVASSEAEINTLKAELEDYRKKMGQLSKINIGEIDAQLREMKKFTAELGTEEAKTEQAKHEAGIRKAAAEEAEEKSKDESKNIGTLLEEIAAMEAKLDKMKKSNQRFFIPAGGASKTPWLVEIRNQHIYAAQAGKRAPPQDFQSVDQLRQFAAQHDHNSEYFVIFVDQSSVDTFRQLRRILQQLQFDVGYDLLAENQTVINPQTGAMPP